MAAVRLPSIRPFVLIVSLAGWALATPTPRVLAQPAQPAEPPATSDELHQLFSEKKYPPLLQKLQRVLALKGAAANGYDRVDLLTLRGEALLQLHQQPAATEAFNLAIKEIGPDTDAKVSAVARATDLLVKRSRALAFTPKKGNAKPISLLDLDQRPAAMAALLVEVKQEATARIRAAKAAPNLPPIFEAMRGIGDVRAVELAAGATGADAGQPAAGGSSGSGASAAGPMAEKAPADAEMQKAVADLATRANELMTQAVAQMSQNTKDVERRANEMIPVHVPAASSGMSRTVGAQPPQLFYKKQGPDANATAALRDTLANCEKIVAVSREFTAADKELAGPFKTLAEAALQAGSKAKEVLTADYSHLYNGPRG